MKKIAIIKPSENKTADEHFNNRCLTIKPFQSNIIGLTLIIKNVNGIEKRIPMWDTSIIVQENIRDHNFFWFEYQSADKEYKISIELD